MPIRFPAARRLAATLFDISICRMPPTDVILDMAARQIMLSVSLDEQRQRNEPKIEPLESNKEPNDNET